MSRRKRSRKNKAANIANQHRSLWPERVIEELLAFLDYGADRKMKPAEINEQAAQHLTMKCDNGNYSFAQVKAKLRRLWKYFGPNDDVSGNPDRIYEEGSKILSWPEEGQREKIARRSREINLEFLTSPRKTRSGSHVVNRSAASPGRFRSASTSPTVMFNGGKTTQTTRVHPLRQQHSNLSSHAEADQDTISPLQKQGASIKTEHADTIFETPQQSSSFCSDNSQFVNAETSRSPLPAVLATPPPVVLASQKADLATRTELERSLESMARRLLQVERKRTLEVDFWRARCISAETERAEVKKMHIALTVKLGQLIQMDQKLDARDIESYEQRIMALEKEINDLHRSERLAFSDAPDLPNDVILDLLKSMRRIDGRLQKLFEGHESNTCPSMLNALENSQLQSLYAKVLNVDLADSTMLDVSQFSGEHISRQTLLRALTAAALAEWVFQGASKDVLFDRYDGDNTRGLTSRYARALKHIESKDPNFARNMDLVIHRDIINEHSFKYFLREKAADLAGRLQDVLAPLWSRPDEVIDAYDDCSSTERSDLIDLIEVFHKALEVQCQLVGTGHSYVCTWHAPGAQFDRISMETGSMISDLDSNAAIVEVTLLPGVNQLPRDYPGAGCGSFLDSSCVVQGVGECLIPAVVSLSGVATA